MTTNEKQELELLSFFVKNKISRFNSMTFPPVIQERLGSSAHAIVNNFTRDGVLALIYGSDEYEFTKIGWLRYKELKRERRSIRAKEIAFWMIFAFSLLSAAQVIWQHAYQESKSKTLAIPMQQSLPPKPTIAPQIVPHTIDSPKK